VSVGLVHVKFAHKYPGAGVVSLQIYYVVKNLAKDKAVHAGRE
jgi:hypothetical protein